MAELRHKALKSEQIRLKRVDRIFLRIAELFLIVSAVFFFMVWVTHREALYITHIQVEGARATPPESIAGVTSAVLNDRLFLTVKRDNLFLYPSQSVEEKIKALSPRIAYAKISFPDPHTLLATVAEYTPTFLYCKKSEGGDVRASSTLSTNNPSDCYFADQKGYVFSAAPEYIGYPFVAIIASSSVEGMPSVSPLGTVPVDPATYKSIRAFVETLSRAGFTTHAITLIDKDDVKLTLDTPWDLLWTTTEKPEASVSNLQVLLTSMNGDKAAKNAIQEIDLRFGNKIFYK